MKLYLLRHGEAENNAPTDSDRQLTPGGKTQVATVARQFVEKNIALDLCYASPYARARQTASEFIESAKLNTVIQIENKLVPEVRAAEVIAFLNTLEAEAVLLVSHNPLLSELTALLVKGNIEDLYIVSTSELVCIDAEHPGIGTGQIVFKLLPDKGSV